MDDKTLARHIKEIGRGKHAGDLARDDAQALFAAMLAGEVADLQLGGILIALRVKGESLDELAGFAAACEASYAHLQPPSNGAAVPVVIPSYNGARQLPNLVPLLALLLAREGIPALVHGITDDPGRITTREVFAALGIAPAISAGEARHQLATVGVSFLPIDALAPQVAALLTLRRELGVRNTAHTLVKMLQPFAGPAVRIVSVTHPEYLVRMREYFTTHDRAALLLRGAEGEAVAHPRREPSMEWADAGTVETWADPDRAERSPTEAKHEQLPDRAPKTTAQWIESVLAGDTPVPRAIAHQLECCRRAVAAVASGARA
jgi:anthranilate phosphoribosyltransferase